MEEGESTVSSVMQEKQTLDGGSVETNGHESGANAVHQNGSVGMAEEQAEAQIQPKSPKPNSQDMRAEVYEKQYKALQQQLRHRDMAMMELADENENLNRALTELKEALKEAVVDRERQTEKIKRQQISIQSAESTIRKAQAEAVDARREGNEAKRDANDARREATETSVALADAKAEVWAIREAAKGKALGEDERRELEGAVRALSASAQRAAQETGSWKEKAQSWKVKLESVNEELEEKSNALTSLEYELSVVRQDRNDSEIRAQEASRLQEVAENALQELRQESDRRARTFNSAVKAAVSKIQSALESERDSALQHIVTIQSDAETKAESLKEGKAALTMAKQELLSAELRISNLEHERDETKVQMSKLQDQIETWQAAAEEAGRKTDAAHEVAGELTNKLLKLESRCEELSDTSDSSKRSTAAMEASLMADISRIKSTLTSAQNENQLLQITSSEKLSKAMAEHIALRAKISDLEGQLRALQTLGSGQRSRAFSDYGLDNLGLDRVNWKSKLRHEDLEKYAGKKTSLDGNQPSTSSWSWTQHSTQDTSLLRGRLSQRSILMIIYIVALHIIVMISFTQKSQNCVDMVGQELARKFPGL